MVELAEKDVCGEAEAAEAPPLAPGVASIDREHLARMTDGERDLEREVLKLYATQATILLERILSGALPARAVAALAHTLSGSSRGIGAWAVAEAAAALEADEAQGRDPAAAVARLHAAVRCAQREIAELVRASDNAA
ncbi:MAG: Hpt domain-containing protein [Hyphomicrobiales bacterium]|nr:Hpt domain-containing protein [Hyphomicrobiales bacterium]